MPALQRSDRPLEAIGARLAKRLDPPRRFRLDVVPSSGASSAVWQPFPGPQTMALHSEADELFYGGQAGGGKSFLLLGLAGTQHRRALVMRRTFPELRGLIDDSRLIFNRTGESHARDSYNEQLHVWRLSDGRVVEFGACQYEKDKENYRGRPHDFYAWDEVTEFSESMFRFINAWCRSTVKGQRCRVIATGNPPSTDEGQWVIKYWGPWLDTDHPNPAAPGELRWFANVEGKDVEVESGEPFVHDGERITPRSRTFIPASLDDNPALRDTGYRSVLQGLPEPMRSQMLYGDFSIRPSANPWQTIPSEWVEAAMKRWTPQAPCAQEVLAADVARGGADKTTLVGRHGTWFAPLVKIPGVETKDGPAAQAHVYSSRQGAPIYVVDVIGVGSSLFDLLTLDGLPVEAFIGSEGTDFTDRSGQLRFRNVRAAAHWKLREALDPINGESIALPPDPELKADLCAPRWTPTPSGIVIEPKDDIKQRLGRSPDCGDAVVMAWWCGGVTSARSIEEWLRRAAQPTEQTYIEGSEFSASRYPGWM